MSELKKLWAKRNKLHKRTQVRLSLVDDILLGHRRKTISVIDRKINDIKWYKRQNYSYVDGSVTEVKVKKSNKRINESKYTY
jgi:hypothetical protein